MRGDSDEVELLPDETREIIFLLGEEDTVETAREKVLHFRQTSAVESEYQKVIENWNQTLETIQVKTPDKKLDLMLNGWLVYQTLVCRFWARSSVYQSSGAYGFRDQLQDAMGLVYAKPELARKHIIRAASRQFKEGDVQHWWHEPSGAERERAFRIIFYGSCLLPVFTSKKRAMRTFSMNKFRFSTRRS